MVARQSYGKLVAFLAARTGDVAGAEDALSEAFASALADWSVNGVPRTPEAWLLTAARRELIDAGRRRRSGDRSGAGGTDAEYDGGLYGTECELTGGRHVLCGSE